MGDILPDGSHQGYVNYCPKCGKTISVNIQGDYMQSHFCGPMTEDEFMLMLKQKTNPLTLKWTGSTGREVIKEFQFTNSNGRVSMFYHDIEYALGKINWTPCKTEVL